MAAREISRAAPDGLVAVADIDVSAATRLRPVSSAGVDTVVASIQELGLMKDPIHVRMLRAKGKRPETLVLIAGAHRLAAAVELGWDQVPARVWECSDDWARLMEIDDNLAGAELTPLDTALFLVERKRVYEQLHPETIAGTAGASARWNATELGSVASFSGQVSDKFGISDRQVRKIIAAGRHLRPAEIAMLRSSPNPVTLADLQHLAKLANDDEREAVIACVQAGEVRNVAKAVKRIRGVAERKKARPEDAAFDALVAAWSRAPKGARTRFLTFIEAGTDR